MIEEQLLPYRKKTYGELLEMIGKQPVTGQMTSPDGVEYQFEIAAFWDNRPNGNIRVMGEVDDGGVRAFFPLCSDFIKAPNNTFIGE